jgi:hypothetical protein
MDARAPRSARAERAAGVVTQEIIKGKLLATVDEMAIVLARASMSPVVYEVLDFACGICDAHGELVAQTNGTLSSPTIPSRAERMPATSPSSGRSSTAAPSSPTASPSPISSTSEVPSPAASRPTPPRSIRKASAFPASA